MISVLINIYRRMGMTLTLNSLAPILLLLAILSYATTGYMYFELPAKPDLSWLDAMWWAFVTMTTVGYGDYFPETTLGRLLVGIPTMLLGVSMLGYVLSVLASFILESKLKEVKGMAQINASDHVIICHFNQVDSLRKLISELKLDASTAKSQIILIDEELEEIPVELVDMGVLFVKGKPSREHVLHQACIAHARSVIIRADERDLGDSDSRNLAVALTIERLFPEVFTVVECVNPENRVYFERANCDSIVCLSSLSSQVMVQELQDPGVHAVLAELTSNLHGRQFYISSVPADQSGTFQQLQSYYQQQHACLLIGLRRGNENLLMPDPGQTISATDQAILIGSTRPA